MSFFSGFMLGQAISGKGNAGDAGLGLLGVLAFLIALALIGLTLVSFLIPLYSVYDLSHWAYGEGELLGALIAFVLSLALVLTAYIMALLGTSKQLFFGTAILALINFVLMSTDDEIAELEFLAVFERQFENAILLAALCCLSLFGVRWILIKLMSSETRSMIVERTLWPTKWVASSKTIAIIAFMASCFALLVGSTQAFETHNRVYQVMQDTGKSYEAAFDIIYYPGRLEGDISFLAITALIALFSAIHFMALLRRKRATFANKPDLSEL